jgi:predicted RNA-binding protein
MVHIKRFESIDDFMDNGGTDDEYLETPEYFIETYINGNFSQLHSMLSKFREDGRIGELVDYIEGDNNSEIINWIARN